MPVALVTYACGYHSPLAKFGIVNAAVSFTDF